MRPLMIVLLVGVLCVILTLSIKKGKYKHKPIVQFPIVNNANIGDSIASIRHWALTEHKIDGMFVYFHYKQTKTDSLRRIVAGYDEKGIWTIFDDKTYIKP